MELAADVHLAGRLGLVTSRSSVLWLVRALPDPVVGPLALRSCSRGAPARRAPAPDRHLTSCSSRRCTSWLSTARTALGGVGPSTGPACGKTVSSRNSG